MHRTLSHSLLQQDHHESRRSLQSTASSQSLLQPPESRRSEPPAWKEFLQQRHESGMPGGRRSVTPRSGRAHNLSHVVEADARSPPALASPGSEALLTAVFDRQPVNHEPLPAVPGAVGAHADARRESRDMTGEGGSVATAGSETGPSPNALEQSARVNTKTFQQWAKDLDSRAADSPRTQSTAHPSNHEAYSRQDQHEPAAGFSARSTSLLGDTELAADVARANVGDQPLPMRARKRALYRERSMRSKNSPGSRSWRERQMRESKAARASAMGGSDDDDDSGDDSQPIHGFGRSRRGEAASRALAMRSAITHRTRTGGHSRADSSSDSDDEEDRRQHRHAGSGDSSDSDASLQFGRARGDGQTEPSTGSGSDSDGGSGGGSPTRRGFVSSALSDRSTDADQDVVATLQELDTAPPAPRNPPPRRRDESNAAKGGREPAAKVPPPPPFTPPPFVKSPNHRPGSIRAGARRGIPREQVGFPARPGGQASQRMALLAVGSDTDTDKGRGDSRDATDVSDAKTSDAGVGAASDATTGRSPSPKGGDNASGAPLRMRIRRQGSASKASDKPSDDGGAPNSPYDPKQRELERTFPRPYRGSRDIDKEAARASRRTLRTDDPSKRPIPDLGPGVSLTLQDMAAKSVENYKIEIDLGDGQIITLADYLAANGLLNDVIDNVDRARIASEKARAPRNPDAYRVPPELLQGSGRRSPRKRSNSPRPRTRSGRANGSQPRPRPRWSPNSAVPTLETMPNPLLRIDAAQAKKSARLAHGMSTVRSGASSSTGTRPRTRGGRRGSKSKPHTLTRAATSSHSLAKALERAVSSTQEAQAERRARYHHKREALLSSRAYQAMSRRQQMRAEHRLQRKFAVEERHAADVDRASRRRTHKLTMEQLGLRAPGGDDEELAEAQPPAEESAAEALTPRRLADRLLARAAENRHDDRHDTAQFMVSVGANVSTVAPLLGITPGGRGETAATRRLPPEQRPRPGSAAPDQRKPPRDKHSVKHASSRRPGLPRGSSSKDRRPASAAELGGRRRRPKHSGGDGDSRGGTLASDITPPRSRKHKPPSLRRLDAEGVPRNLFKLLGQDEYSSVGAVARESLLSTASNASLLSLSSEPRGSRGLDVLPTFTRSTISTASSLSLGDPRPQDADRTAAWGVRVDDGSRGQGARRSGSRPRSSANSTRRTTKRRTSSRKGRRRAR